MKINCEMLRKIYPHSDYKYCGKRFDYYLQEQNDLVYVSEKVKWYLFIPLYIPAVIHDFCVCCWYDGMREYHLPTRTITKFSFHSNPEYIKWKDSLN